MTDKEQKVSDQYESQVHEADDIPEEERAKEGGDDEDAERKSLELESVRPWRVAKSLDALLRRCRTREPKLGPQPLDHRKRRGRGDGQRLHSRPGPRV
jgi:hypothetical protein